MTFAKYPPENISEAITVFKQDVELAHGIIHGDENTEVLTENGPVPSFQKVIKYLEDEVASATGVDVSLRSDLADGTADIGGVQAKKVAASGIAYITPSMAAETNLKTVIESLLSFHKLCVLRSGDYTSASEIEIPAFANVMIEAGANVDFAAGVNGFKLLGSGSKVFGEGRIVGKSSLTTDANTKGVYSAVPAQECVVHGISIKDFGIPVYFKDSIRCKARFLRIDGYRSMGIWFDSTIVNGFASTTQDAQAIFNELTTTYGSYTTGTQAKGIFMSGVRPLVAKNKIDGGANVLSTGYGAGEQFGQRDGIWFNFAQDFMAWDNESRNNVDDGITVYRSVRGIIADNKLNDSWATVGCLIFGGEEQYCEDIYLVNNDCQRNGYGGISSLRGRNIVIQGNNLKYNGADAFVAANALAGFGVLAEISEGLTVQGGTVSENKRWGVFAKTVSTGETVINNSGIVIKDVVVSKQQYNVVCSGTVTTKHNPVTIENVTSLDSDYPLYLQNVLRAEVNDGTYGSHTNFISDYGIWAEGVLDLIVNGSSLPNIKEHGVFYRPSSPRQSGEGFTLRLKSVSFSKIGDGTNANSAAVDMIGDVLTADIDCDNLQKYGINFTGLTFDSVVNVTKFTGYNVGATSGTTGSGTAIRIANAIRRFHISNVNVMDGIANETDFRCDKVIDIAAGFAWGLLNNVDAIRSSSKVVVGTAGSGGAVKQFNVTTSYT